MALSKVFLNEMKKLAYQDEVGKSFFTEALTVVMNELEKFPPSVMCMVGETVADEGAYRLISKIEEGEEDWESWHNNLY